MRRAALVGSAALLCAAAAFAGEAQPTAKATSAALAPPAPGVSQLLGFVDGRLVRVDPDTLRPEPQPALYVGSGGCVPRSGGTACWTNPAWTASPDGRRILIARNDAAKPLHIVDATRLRVTNVLEYRGRAVGAVAWPTGRHVLALKEICCNERQLLVAVDLRTRRIGARHELGGSVQQIARLPNRLVFLVTPPQAIGPARIAVADARGTVRTARLERIVAGTELLRGASHRVDARQPGLAVDLLEQRAFVVTEELVAAVDLRTLEVAYHELQEPRSLLSRLWGWLEPAAWAKQVSGYDRRAEWLGGGLIAVAGSDAAGGRPQPAGLRVIDTRSWTSRTLDPHAVTFAVADGSLLTTGWRWDSSATKAVGTGLAAYRVDGSERFRLFDGDHAWLAQVYDGRAYVTLASAQDRLRVIDLARGVVIGLRDPILPTLLVGRGAGWWDG